MHPCGTRGVGSSCPLFQEDNDMIKTPGRTVTSHRSLSQYSRPSPFLSLRVLPHTRRRDHRCFPGRRRLLPPSSTSSSPTQATPFPFLASYPHPGGSFPYPASSSPTPAAPLPQRRRPPPPGAPNARRSGGHGTPAPGSLSLPYVAIVCFNLFQAF